MVVILSKCAYPFSVFTPSPNPSHTRGPSSTRGFAQGYLQRRKFAWLGKYIPIFVVTSYEENRFYNRLEVLKYEISAFGFCQVSTKSVDELDFK